jgi:methylenetetrahydrofolate--tRNA-(uracil-5-)-methyltransferase
MSKVITQSLRNSGARVVVVGGGLAGSECAWALAERGISVALVEQRPLQQTAAHKTGDLAELVCSNSLKSTDPESAPALLKSELQKLNSLILSAAYKHQVPAGQALAVDREAFSREITQKIEKHPRIEVLRGVVEHFEEVFVSGPKGLRPVVLATGPLTGESLATSLESLTGKKLYFYDAIAPILEGASINREIAFKQNRYQLERGASAEEGDYLNCPLNKEEYFRFIEALKAAEKVDSKDFEKLIYFQGCQPIEAMLESGPLTLAHGPMKPKGLVDPRTGEEPFAAVQLRSEDTEGRSWNLVGFQTKMKYPEQKRVFSLIPGLENANFYRYGSLHRNTYIHSPTLLDNQFRMRKHPLLHFAGQVTGVEGYLESTAIGAYVGATLAYKLKMNMEAPPPPPTTALGALIHAIVQGNVKNFQPMNMNWGLVHLNGIDERDKEKRKKLAARADRHFDSWRVLVQS